MDVGTDAYSLNYRGLYSDLYVNLLSHKRVYKRPKKRVTMSELEQNLSNNALMLVVEMLAAKELYDSTRTTEDFEFLCEKRKALESYIAELEEFINQLIETGEGVVINYQSAWTIQNGAESPVSKVPPSIRKWRELTADRKAG